MYLVRYYDHYFSPNVAMIIVEQGLQPSVEPASLPGNCKYVFVRDNGPFNQELCFAEGIKHSEPSRKRFILTDSDIYLETLHIRANLRLCERYDSVSGFDKLIDLDKQDSVRLRAAKSPQGIDLTKELLLPKNRKSVCLFLNREAIEKIGQRGKSLEAALSLFTSRRLNHDRNSQSPNHALRLH
jgi:hypothetical protein